MEKTNAVNERPHLDIFLDNPAADYGDYYEAIDKRLRQAEAITFMGIDCDTHYVFQQKTGSDYLSLLHDLITEVRFFQGKMLEKIRSQFSTNK